MTVILGTILIILMIVIGEERGVAGVFVLAGNMILLWMCIKFIANGSSVFLVLFIGSMIFTGLIQMIIALPVYYIGDYCKARPLDKTYDRKI